MEEGSTQQSPPAGEKLTRVLGAGDSASIMISNMIGTGILTLPPEFRRADPAGLMPADLYLGWIIELYDNLNIVTSQIFAV